MIKRSLTGKLPYRWQLWTQQQSLHPINAIDLVLIIEFGPLYCFRVNTFKLPTPCASLSDLSDGTIIGRMLTEMWALSEMLSMVIIHTLLLWRNDWPLHFTTDLPNSSVWMSSAKKQLTTGSYLRLTWRSSSGMEQSYELRDILMLWLTLLSSIELQAPRWFLQDSAEEKHWHDQRGRQWRRFVSLDFELYKLDNFIAKMMYILL